VNRSPLAAARLATLAAGLLMLAQAACAIAATPIAPAHPPCTVGQRVLRQEPLEIVTVTGVHRFLVEMADNELRREIGMMCRTSEADGGGMLFQFQTAQDVSFWMRNTLIPLDIIYIAADGRIVSIARNAVPLDETPIPSGGVITGVLELRGGRAAEIGAMPGDRVRQRIFHR
jgi:uncharacterized membrane protein (UPF0127 family)